MGTDSRSTLDAFLSWATERGILSNGLEIRVADEDSGNGVFATRSFQPESILIRLPRRLMLTAGVVAEIPRYAELIRAAGALPTPFELLTLFFCLEDPSTSEYGPYLRMLPQDFTTPAFEGIRFDSAEVPSTARAFYELQLKELDGVRDRISLLGSGSINHERFLWAWHVVNTRCIYVENPPHPLVDSSHGDTIAVIPFVDMLNHDPNAQGFAFLDKIRDEYCVRAMKTVREGEQFFVCYGPHDNIRLWIEYGFRLADNPNGKVQVPSDLFLALARKCDVNVTPEHEKALVELAQPCTLYASDEGPSWSLRANMQILMMSPEELPHWEEAVYANARSRLKSTSSMDPTDNAGDDEENEEGDRERAERETLARMLGHLAESIRAKAGKVDKRLAWAWEEQASLVDVVIQRLQKPL